MFLLWPIMIVVGAFEQKGAKKKSGREGGGNEIDLRHGWLEG